VRGMNRPGNTTPKKMIKGLKRAGFVEHHTKGSHVYLWHAGKKLMTSVPMHNKDLKRGLMMAIIKQANLSDEEIEDLF